MIKNRSKEKCPLNRSENVRTVGIEDHASELRYIPTGMNEVREKSASPIGRFPLILTVSQALEAIAE